MKARSAALYGALASASLVAAAVAWRKPPEHLGSSRDVVVLEATKQSLERVRFEDGTSFVELTREVRDEPVVWVTQGPLATAAAPAPAAPGRAPGADDSGTSTTATSDGGEGLAHFDGGEDGIAVVGLDAGVDGGTILVNVKPAAPRPTRRTYGSDVAFRAFEQFLPLEATRDLGVLGADKLAELGLDATDRRLEVRVAGTAHGFLVSKPNPDTFGTYLLDARSNRVYLMQGSLFSDLDPTSQALVQRRLHSFSMLDVDRFVVDADGRSVAFASTPAPAPARLSVVREGKGPATDELARNWYEKTWTQLVVTEVLGQGENPQGGEPRVILRIEYFARGRSKGRLELGVNKAGTSWARSENTAGWVALHHGAEELALEATKVITGT